MRSQPRAPRVREHGAQRVGVGVRATEGRDPHDAPSLGSDRRPARMTDMTQRHRDPGRRPDRARGRARRRRARARLHRLRGGGRRRRARAPLGPRAPLHPLGDERLRPRARRRSARGARRATSCPPATSWPTPARAARRLPALAPACGSARACWPSAARGCSSTRRSARERARGRGRSGCSLADADGREWIEHADVVIDGTGTYGNPNSLGDGGIPAPGERGARGPDRALPARVRRATLGRARPCCSPAPATRRRPRARLPLRRRRRARGSSGRCATRQPDWGAVDGDPLPERAALNAAAAALAAGASPASSCAPARSPRRSPSATAGWR